MVHLKVMPFLIVVIVAVVGLFAVWSSLPSTPGQDSQQGSIVGEAFRGMPRAPRAASAPVVLPVCSLPFNGSSNGSIPCCGDRVCQSSDPLYGPESYASCPRDCTACADAMDNDADGLIDIADPGCHNAGVLTRPYYEWKNCERDPFVCGDVNRDGSATILDVLFINQWLGGQRQLDAQQLICGDVNRDGRVDVLDVQTYTRFFSAPPSGPSGAPWVLRCSAECTAQVC